MKHYAKFTDNIYDELEEYMENWEPYRMEETETKQEYQVDETKGVVEGGKKKGKQKVMRTTSRLMNPAVSLRDFAEKYNYSYDTLMHWRDKAHPNYKEDIYVQATNRVIEKRRLTLLKRGEINEGNISYNKYRMGLEYGEWDRQKVDSENVNVNAELDAKRKITEADMKALGKEGRQKMREVLKLLEKGKQTNE